MMQLVALWGIAMAGAILWLVSREQRLADRGKVPLGRLRRLWFKTERRRAPRYRVNWEVYYRRANPPAAAQGATRDVSQTGAGLTVWEKLPVGSLLHLEIRLPSQPAPLQATAVVVWSKEVPAGPEAGDLERHFFVGIRFQNLDAKLEEELARALGIRRPV